MKIMDEDNDRALTLEQFKKVFVDYKINIAENDVAEIFYFLDS